MFIKNLKVSNFKSFESLDIELDKFNVLIGANAAGKSNFIQMFKFIRDIVTFGLDNAISLQGGFDYLRNINLQEEKDSLKFSFTIDPEITFGIGRKTQKGTFGLRLKSLTNDFSLSFSGDDNSYKIDSDKLDVTFDIFELENVAGKIEEKNLLGQGDLIIRKDPDKINLTFKTLKKIGLTEADLFPEVFSQGAKLNSAELKTKLLLESNLLFLLHLGHIKEFFRKVTIFDFDSKLPKKATQFMGKAELEENGENLAIVLRRILTDEGRRNALFNFLYDVLPYVEDIEVEKLWDKYIQLMMKEKFNKEKYVPASMMSDGTIFILALITALYFEEKPVTIFEEAGRRLHPYLISKVIDMMIDASKSKQVILSTHNPEIVKYSGTENLILISRDKEGYSTISHPHKKEEIQTFMQNEIGIEELYIQNLLGG